MSVRLLFLGELCLHKSAFLPFLSTHGYDITVINTSHWSFPKKITGTDISVYNLYENTKTGLLFRQSGWFEKALFYGLVGKTSFICDKIQKVIKQKGIDVIYSSWGSHSLPELRLVQEFGVPVVYDFVAYPTSLHSFAEKTENALNRSVINGLDGRVLPTQRMLHYLKTVFNLRDGENIVFTESYSRRTHYRRRLPRLSDSDGKPHLIFLGLNEWTILSQLEEMMRRGIHLHVVETRKGLRQRLRKSEFKSFRHEFKKFDLSRVLDGTLATFMTQFDACLVTYNFGKASTLNRFFNSIPNRFSFSLTAGIPIIMPKGYLKGCEEIINKHQIGFTYTDYNDLKNKLNDTELMNYYRHNAAAKANLFTLEANFKKIDVFLRKIAKVPLK